MVSKSSKQPRKYISPYVGAVLLGLVLLASFYLTGQGLGASGALTSIVVAIEKAIAPEYVNSSPFHSAIGGGDTNPLNIWLFYMLVGIFLGALVSGAWAGRLKIETNRGPRISDKQRWAFALIGGLLFGLGAKIARGCTSGFLLTGGSSLFLGPWIAIPIMFAVAYGVAFLVRKLWV